MKKIVVALSVIGLLLAATASYAAITRIDVNGELVNPLTTPLGPTTPSTDLANKPAGWDVYNTIDTNGNPLGAVGFNYFSGTVGTGGDGNYIGKYCNPYERNDGNYYYPPTTQPTTGYGHSVALGMSIQGGGASSYGISQTFNATAGKLYWLAGEETFGGALTSPPAGYTFTYGLQEGYGTSGGRTEKQYPNNTSLVNGGRFMQAIVAQNSGPMTVHVGQNYDGVGAPSWFISYVDSIRVFEADIPVYSDLQNGSFETAVNQTDFGGNQQDDNLFPGWLVLGGGCGKYMQSRQWTGAGHFASGAASGDLLMRAGSGRICYFQRVNKGAGVYTLNGKMMNSTNGDANNDTSVLINARIGIDPNGGLDPNAASVVWSDYNHSNKDGLWHAISALNVNGGSDGVTVFLAAGDDADTNVNLNYYQQAFDSITLTYVPEPSSLLALGIGLVSLVGIVRRKR